MEEAQHLALLPPLRLLPCLFFLALNAGQEPGRSAEMRDLDPNPPNVACCVCYAYRGAHFPTVTYSPLGGRGGWLCLPAQPISLGCAMAVAG